MAVYNSSVGLSNQDDSDITIINPSILHENNDEDVNNTYVPIITRLKQANNSSENRQIPSTETTHDDKQEYIFVDHDPLKNAKNLENILIHYIRDLKQETNTQLDCDKQLIIRLMDSIRLAYINDQQKMIALDKIMEEIGLLHDKRYLEQKEKIEQLRTEICRLNKMLFTANNDQSLYNENDHHRTTSIFNTIHRGQSINDYDQWTEIEDDAKKLHELVQSQKNQINEIVSLISETVSAPASLVPTNTAINQSEETTTTDQQTTPTPSTNILSTLLKKIQDIAGQQISTQLETVTTPPPSNSILENHSPDISPTNSMATLTLKTLQTTIEEQSKPIDENHHQEPIPDEQSHVPIDIPVSSIVPAESKKCPVCNHEFDSTSNDVEMYDHIERCLFPTGIQNQPQDYECPNCTRKYPGNEERDYLQHLSDCYNREL